MSTRLGLALGFMLTTATAVWWLGASRVALQSGGGTVLLAAQALFVLDLLRAMLIALLSPRLAAAHGYLAGVRSAIPIVTMAWPVVALACIASAEDIMRTLLVEVGLLCSAVVVPAFGYTMARLRAGSPMVVPLASLFGVVLACGVWVLALEWARLASWAHA